MQMSNVFIVQFGDDGELDRSTDALRKKSAITVLDGTTVRLQPGAISGAIVLAGCARPSASDWQKYFNTDNKIRQFMNQVSQAKDNVGLYIVSHGYYTGGMGTVSGAINGKELATAVIALGFTSLDKVNLSACNMAGKSVDDHDRTFISDFAVKLAAEGMRPLIACYVGYNTPALSPRQFTIPPSVAPKDQNQTVKLKKSVVDQGGTIVKNGNNSTPLRFVDDRNQFKKAFQLDTSGTLVPRTLAQWHSG